MFHLFEPYAISNTLGVVVKPLVAVVHRGGSTVLFVVGKWQAMMVVLVQRVRMP